MTPPNKPAKIRATLLDDTVPLPQRRQLLMHLCMDDGEESGEVLESILKDAKTPKSHKSIYEKKTRELAQLLEQMMEGPLRHGTFVRMVDALGSARRAYVKLEDGSSAFVPVPDEKLARRLRCGETVLIEAQGKALLFRDPILPAAGEEARFERRLDAQRIEVALRDHESHVLHVSAALAELLDAGEVSPGRRLLVCSRRNMAFDAVPDADGPSRYRYLCREPVPDVVVERDIGAPPEYLDELVEVVREEMVRPALRRKYRLPRCVLKLLSGVSGSGKTYSILGMWRRLYEVMAEVTGVSVDDLPPRVMRLRSSQVLSKWLGDSDKNLDRFFDEAEALADESFTAPDGRAYRLPVLVVLEEIDGLARARGDEPVMDRILTTALRRLDTTRPELRTRLILFLATTNVAGQVDPAFLRRVGGTVERFGRLARPDFVAVLGKHLRGRPVGGASASDEETARRRLVADVTGWLFSGNGNDPGQVEIHYTGSGAPDTKYRRDFLTPALVDRAVAEASAEACRLEAAGQEDPGLTTDLLVEAFDRQVRSIVDQLHPTNAADHVDLPDGVRVASVRRIRQRSVQLYELERAA